MLRSHNPPLRRRVPTLRPAHLTKSCQSSLKRRPQLPRSKQQQTSDWGASVLTDAQLEYAASDVLYLHKLKAELESRLRREGRMDLAERLFAFLPTRAELDLLGWEDTNAIFLH